MILIVAFEEKLLDHRKDDAAVFFLFNDSCFLAIVSMACTRMYHLMI